jgi:plastocyanin
MRPRDTIMRHVIALAAALLCTPVFAVEHVVYQSGKAFSAASLKAKVGDTLAFHNKDPFVHNIFSLSEVHSFDLGTFVKGEVRKVILAKAGRVEVECAVHPEMKLVVDVEK